MSHRSWVAGLCLTAQAAFSIGTAVADSAAPAAILDRGKYIATAGNCASCHTAPDGEPFAGGLAFKTDFGTIYSTNITSDTATGIGKWTEQQFINALRQGVKPDGTHLYPVFPYTSFTKISSSDAVALFQYLKSVPAVSATAPENDLSFPYSQRWLLGAWKSMFFTEGTYAPDSKQSAEWNRGAYLVEGLGHCSACHSPRNFLGAESTDAALTGGVYTDKVATGELRTWAAPNLTTASNGLGGWTVAEIASYLKTGKNDHAITFGPMNEVILNSTQHLNDADTRAMATYLKSLAANEGEVGSPAGNDVQTTGASLYDVHCGTCHQPSGMGAADSGPRLAGSLVVQANDPSTLINVILYAPEVADAGPSIGQWQKMEAYGEKLSDEEVATLASYVRSAWKNKGGEVTASQVAKQR